MKISLDWLQDFIELQEKDPGEIAKRVTAGVAEVDDVELQGGLLDNTCVGKVLSVAKHPNADRLSMCEVQTDKGAKRVVCGGTNLRVGMRVAFAHTGARVRWHGTEMMTLEKTKIRGVESEGMICAAEELDLADRFPEATERNIVDMGDGDEGVGKSLKEYLRMDDVVLHIDNHAITHRPDLFSHVGFAREFVALGLGKWKKAKKPAAPKFTKDKLPFSFVAENKDLVPHYTACLIAVDGLGTTPDWMKKRLEATGWRSVNLPVDITNYVLMEMGMPLHCFDADDIQGDMHIRLSKNGETVTTLDGETRKLIDGCLVISDDKGIFDLLGIMGGLRSSTKETTKHMYIHAAILNPLPIRRGILSTGHRTEGSTVYEKGVPRVMSLPGLLRALELFLELVPGARIASKLETWGDEGKASPIELPLERVTKTLGVEIAEKKITKILEDLEFSVNKKPETRNQKPERSSASLTITPPLHRLGDIKGPHDLIEEIGRVYGYNEIEAQLPAASIQPPPRETRIHRMRDALKEQRYVELLPLSLLGPSLLRKANLDPSDAVALENPIGEELSLLHTSTLPGLLEHAERNILNSSPTLRAFHNAHIFSKKHGERQELGLLRATMHSSTKQSIADEPVLLLKRDLSAMISPLGYEIETVVSGSAPAYAHPGRFAEILLVTEDGDDAHPRPVIGTIFELHPNVASRFSLRHRAAAALIDVQTLLKQPKRTKTAMPLPQFPAIQYDVTLTLSHRQQAADIVKALRDADPLLESVEAVDVYSGKSVKDDEYSLTLRFTYRAGDRTLTEAEAKPVHDKVLQAVQ